MSDSSDDDEKRASRKVKSPLDVQRLQIEKLMSDPVFSKFCYLLKMKKISQNIYCFKIKLKEVVIPDMKKDSKLPRAFNTHEFVRNVMGELFNFSQ